MNNQTLVVNPPKQSRQSFNLPCTAHTTTHTKPYPNRLPLGSMYPNSIYIGSKVLIYGPLYGQSIPIWVHGPLGLAKPGKPFLLRQIFVRTWGVSGLGLLPGRPRFLPEIGICHAGLVRYQVAAAPATSASSVFASMASAYLRLWIAALVFIG